MKTVLVKMSLIFFFENKKIRFHINAVSLALKQRPDSTRKWPIINESFCSSDRLYKGHCMLTSKLDILGFTVLACPFMVSYLH